MRRLRNCLVALLIGCFAPLFIWTGAGVALYQRRQRITVPEMPLPNWACSIDTDCPGGFVCVNGYCMPEKAA